MKTLIALSLGLLAASSALADDNQQNRDQTQASQSCNMQIIAKGDNAVGNPCMTQDQYIASLNLSKRAQRRLTNFMNNPQLVGVRTPESERMPTAGR